MEQSLKTHKATEKHVEYDDSMIPDFTIAEARKIFADNIPDFNKEMPRASLSPKKEAEFLCIAWLFK